MAKFCTKCGKKLEEGEKCTCSQNVSTTTANAGSVDFNQLFNDYVNIIKGIFTRPSDTIKEYAKGGKFLLGIIALVIKMVWNNPITFHTFFIFPPDF